MGAYKVNLSKIAQRDVKKVLKSYPPAQQNKLHKIMGFLTEDPYFRVFGWEQLKHIDCYSYELNKKDRVYFTIDDDFNTVNVLSCLGHYDDH